MEPKPPMEPKPLIDGASLIDDLLDEHVTLNDDLDAEQNLNASAKMGWNWQCPTMQGHSTECVHISHNNWFNNKAKFQAHCDGELDGFYESGPGAQNLQDCGQACWGCSFLRACCIGRVVSIKGRYEAVGHYSATAREVTVTEGVSIGHSTTTSITASMERSFSVGIEGLFSAGASSSLSATVSTTYSHTKTSTVSLKETQPAQSRLWQYVLDFTDVYGVTRTLKAGTVLTGDNNAPTCQPGGCSDKFSAGHGSCRQCHSGQALSDVSAG